jgi:uncharacterized protein YjiS (DUF1127 family)
MNTAAQQSERNTTMAMTLSRTNIKRATLLDSIREHYLQAREAVHQARLRRARYVSTLSELVGMSDRELNDLGIARANIRKIAKQELQTGEIE